MKINFKLFAIDNNELSRYAEPEPTVAQYTVVVAQSASIAKRWQLYIAIADELFVTPSLAQCNELVAGGLSKHGFDSDGDRSVEPVLKVHCAILVVNVAIKRRRKPTATVAGL